jgi:hypothetical protein
MGEHAPAHVANIDGTVAVVLSVRLLETGRHRAQDLAIAPSRRPALPLDRLDRLLGRVGILEDRDLGVQDARVLLAGLDRDLLAERGHLVQARADRRPEARLLLGHLVGRDLPVVDLDFLRIDDVNRTDADSGRRGNSRENGHSSPNLSLTTLTSASSASRSSVPSTRNVSSAPRSAASIITPRMLLPFTSSPSRESVI